MEKHLRQRKQLRRKFTINANSLETKLKEYKNGVTLPWELKTEYEYLGDVAERMFASDSTIQNLTLESKEGYEEEQFEKLFDEAESYKKRWMALRYRFESAAAQEDRQSQAGSVGTTRSCKNLKLPKLELRKFDDDPKNWLGFWGQFRKIDEDTDLSDDDKYQYLVQAMKENSNARELVESFPPSGTSYRKALDHLKSRFARDEILVETYVRELLRLVLCQAKGEYLLDTRSLYDKLMTYLQALDALGVTKDKYEAMLYPLVESALSESILLAWSRSQGQQPKHSDQLNQLLGFLRTEVEAEERIRLSRAEFVTGSSSSSCNNEKITPTAACFVSTEAKETKNIEGNIQICFFCDKSSHSILECSKAHKMTLEEKMKALKKHSACFNCLKKGHSAKFCRNKVFLKCLSCQKRHLVIMCPELHKAKIETIKPCTNQCLCLKNKTTLLQTLFVRVENKNKVKKVRALLDSGSQRSYVRSSIVDELRLKVVGTEALGHALFGGVVKKCELHRRVQLKVSSLDSTCNISMTCLEQKQLCGELPKLNDIGLCRKLRGLDVQLNDVDYDETEIDLLIGCDYLGSIMKDSKTVLLGDSLIAIKTDLGWTLQGPLESTSMGTKTNTLFCYPQEICNTRVLNVTDPYVSKEQMVEEKLLKPTYKNKKVREEGISPVFESSSYDRKGSLVNSCVDSGVDKKKFKPTRIELNKSARVPYRAASCQDYTKMTARVLPVMQQRFGFMGCSMACLKRVWECWDKAHHAATAH